MKIHLVHNFKPDGFSGNPDFPLWWAKCVGCGKTYSTHNTNANRNGSALVGWFWVLLVLGVVFTFQLLAWLYMHSYIFPNYDII